MTQFTHRIFLWIFFLSHNPNLLSPHSTFSFYFPFPTVSLQGRWLFFANLTDRPNSCDPWNTFHPYRGLEPDESSQLPIENVSPTIPSSRRSIQVLCTLSPSSKTITRFDDGRTLTRVCGLADRSPARTHPTLATSVHAQRRRRGVFWDNSKTFNPHRSSVRSLPHMTGATEGPQVLPPLSRPHDPSVAWLP